VHGARLPKLHAFHSSDPFFGTYWIGFDFSVQTPTASPLSAIHVPRTCPDARHGNALVGDRSGATSVPTVDEHGDALDHGAERRLPHARPMTADATLVST